MTAIKNHQLSLGSRAPEFSLLDCNQRQTTIKDVKLHHGFLLVFGCNHCPYVKNIQSFLPELQDKLDELDIGMVMISSNDVANYPEDGPREMDILAAAKGFEFPYLYDESQQTAKDYGAACTPDFYLFDADDRLYYHGQLDDSRPGNEIEVSGEYLLDAALKMSNSMAAPTDQKQSVGCSIKWK